MKPATWLNPYFTHDTRGNIYRVLYQPSTHLKDKTIPGCLWLSTKVQGCSLSVEVKFFCKPYSNRSKRCICCGLLSATDYYILESASILSVLSPFMCFLGFWGFLLFCSPPPPPCVHVFLCWLVCFWSFYWEFVTMKKCLTISCVILATLCVQRLLKQGKWIPLVVEADGDKVEKTAGDLVGCSDRI